MDENTALSALENSARYLFVTRSRSAILKQLSVLSKLKARIIRTKKRYMRRKDEQNANKWLSIENLCKSIIAGLQSFVELKNGKPDQAWLSLVSAQDYVWFSSAHDLQGDLQKLLSLHFYKVEKVVFPPQIFLSRGTTTKKSLCGICGRPFPDCDHMRGEAYMGKLCAEIISESVAIDHVAIVAHPADKKCRVECIHNINQMTLE